MWLGNTLGNRWLARTALRSDRRYHSDPATASQSWHVLPRTDAFSSNSVARCSRRVRSGRPRPCEPCQHQDKPCALLQREFSRTAAPIRGGQSSLRAGQEAVERDANDEEHETRIVRLAPGPQPLHLAVQLRPILNIAAELHEVDGGSFRRLGAGGGRGGRGGVEGAWRSLRTSVGLDRASTGKISSGCHPCLRRWRTVVREYPDRAQDRRC